MERSPGARAPRVRWVVLLLLLAVLLLAAVQLALAARAAASGRSALEAAERSGRARDVPATERHLRTAQRDLASARGHVSGAGPVIWLARVTPFVRVQTRAAEGILAAGELVARAGLRVLPTVGTAFVDDGRKTDVSQVVATLAHDAPQVHRAVEELTQARARVAVYDGWQLVGPLDDAQEEVSTRLTNAVDQATRAERALTVVLDLTGAQGARRFLLLSQNPDEPRPTGGYMGTYGVLAAKAGHLDLERYEGMGLWHSAHPEAAVPAARTPFPFQYTSEPQSLGNVNTTPDWPASARLARQIWRAGGEADVDGVLTYLPGLIGRLLAATGPVRVPAYGETVSSADLDARLEFWTHSEARRGLPTGVRKAFIGALGEAVLARALDLPPSRLPDLATAFDGALRDGELALWSTRPPVQAALGDLGWDGAFRGADGDAFVDAEFAFAAKNGRGIRRTFDHVATLRPDGSGTSATTVTIRDTQPFESGYNLGTFSYLTPYGPRGATLAAGSDRPERAEPPLAGHPTAGWLRDAPPLGSDRLRVVWRAPQLAAQAPDGHWEYRLTWQATPGHRGDVLRLRVELPPGWRWKGAAPPSTVRLDGRFEGRWDITAA